MSSPAQNTLEAIDLPLKNLSIDSDNDVPKPILLSPATSTTSIDANPDIDHLDPPIENEVDGWVVRTLLRFCPVQQRALIDQ